ncbi:MAG: ABC transporter permease [Candidatus Rokubacteria bacterium]|nr:ABC transporter permease [Candidatus Rokubacteria bacterium]
MDPEAARRLLFDKAPTGGWTSLYEYVYDPAPVLSSEAFLLAIVAVVGLLWAVRRFTPPVLARGGLTIGVVLVLWEAVPTLGILNPVFFPPPTAVLDKMAVHWQRGWLPQHILASLGRFSIAFGLAIAIGVPTGFLISLSSRLWGYVGSILYFIRGIPPPAWLPIFILWAGAGNPAAVFVVFLGAFFPILIGTVDGFKKADPVQIETVRTFGGNRFDVFWEVQVPTSLPDIVIGIRIGLGIGWMMLIAAELAVARLGTGVGWMITHARIWYDSAVIMGGMVVIAIMGLAVDLVLRRALARWADLPRA